MLKVNSNGWLSVCGIGLSRKSQDLVSESAVLSELQSLVFGIIGTIADGGGLDVTFLDVDGQTDACIVFDAVVYSQVGL